MVYYEMKKIFSKTSGRIAVICLIGLLIVVCGFAVSGVSYMNEQGEKEMKRKISELVDLKVYVKPEEGKAHYVINGEITGSIEL